MDTVHPTQSKKLSYGWIRKSQDKLIEQRLAVHNSI